jgi:hypothetical protein
MPNRLRTRVVLFACSLLLLAAPQSVFALCDQTLVSGANIAEAVLAVPSGATICLSAGSYPAFTASISKSSTTTITAAPGVSQDDVTIPTMDIGASQYLAFTHITIGRAIVGSDAAPALHTQFVGVRFTGSLCINDPIDVNQDTLVDSSTFTGGQSCNEGRLGVNSYNNFIHNVPSGIVISNNVFGPGGCSDGIQLASESNRVQILHNEFVGIRQSGCGSVHVDPIQFYGAVGTVVNGNYFHGNDTGIMSPDCNGRSSLVTNNVFVTDGSYPDQIVISGQDGGTFDHNTFHNGARMRFGNPNGCGLVTNVTLTNNIVTGELRLSEGQTKATFTIEFNNGIGGGGHAIDGTPTFVGGSQPSTWQGFRLAADSIGKNAGGDGKDIGATEFGPTTRMRPPAPTNLRIVR